MKAVYLHVPFCDSICAYCDFCRIITNEDTKSKWMAQIIEEIKQKISMKRILYILEVEPQVH